MFLSLKQPITTFTGSFYIYIYIFIYIHPPQVIIKLPNSINERLLETSSNESVFKASKCDYEDSLKRSGYTNKLEYPKEPIPKTSRTRKRNVIWFNPPFCQTVKTNVAKLFLHLVDKHFPRGNAQNIQQKHDES